MKKYFLLTAFGKDRPGLVAGVSQVLWGSGGNVEDASMTRLGGEFSMMLVTALPPTASRAKLDKDFQALRKKMKLQIEVKPIPAAAAHQSKQESPKYLISVYGTDHPGIVYQVTQALFKRRVSITDLQTKIIGRSKLPIYVMLLEIKVSDSLDLDGLRSDLEALRRDLKVEITLQDIEAIAL